MLYDFDTSLQWKNALIWCQKYFEWKYSFIKFVNLRRGSVKILLVINMKSQNLMDWSWQIIKFSLFLYITYSNLDTLCLGFFKTCQFKLMTSWQICQLSYDSPQTLGVTCASNSSYYLRIDRWVTKLFGNMGGSWKMLNYVQN